MSFNLGFDCMAKWMNLFHTIFKYEIIEKIIPKQSITVISYERNISRKLNMFSFKVFIIINVLIIILYEATVCCQLKLNCIVYQIYTMIMI